MILKKVKLHNIRSYKDAELKFPEGSVLLSGNVGSGKTSVLLAADFALFGLARGTETLKGASLLRNGTDFGYVELQFLIDGKDIIIKRALKRKKGKVQQGGASLSVNGREEELSPTELKQRVLGLLNYPQEFLTKDKGLIYRYTVYTQQEQMRQILLEDAASRLDTLRRVFGVDKYKIILTNSTVFGKKLGGEVRLRQGKISDLQDKKKELAKQKKVISDSEEKLRKLIPLVTEAGQEVERIKQKLAEAEEKQAKLAKLKEKLSSKNAEQKSKTEQYGMVKQTIKQLENELGGEKKELAREKFSKVELTKADRELEVCKRKLKQAEQARAEFEKTISAYETKKERAEQVSKKIRKLNKCPECGQDVTEAHKKEVLKRCRGEVKSLQANIKIEQEKISKAESQAREFETVLRQTEERKTKLTEVSFKLKACEEKEKQFKQLETERKVLTDKLVELDKILSALGKKIEKYASLEEDYKSLRKQLEANQTIEKQLSIQKAELEKERDTIGKQLASLAEEIFKKEKLREEMHSLVSLREWLGKDFTNLVEQIEKSVMAKLHVEFSSLLEKWFGMLVEGDLLVRLDSDFTPLVEQAGHDVDYAYLSGGERTAVALAYRLALNQVINSFMSRIKTRDILILDEPTDGFSSEQLDRMRDVLAELKVRQLVLVSHEQKMESFVDCVLRFEKEGHVTRVSG